MEDLIQLNRDMKIGLSDSVIRSESPVNVSKKIPIKWPDKVFEETITLEKAAFKYFDYSTEGVVEIE